MLENVPRADALSYRPAPGSIPDQPGVYRFWDRRDTVIYVGKAKSLRSRLNSYFADPASLHPRTSQMVTTATRVDWVVVSTEVEALQLEYTWIKEFDPRFNVRYRDDKSYPSLAVTLNEEFPRLQVMRGPKKKGVKYFGPYSHAWAIRETLDLLLRVFPARTCSTGVFKRAGQIGRPCLLGYIGKCSAPCVGRVSADEHRQIVTDFVDFMSGKTDKMVRRLEREMSAAATELDFERAARLRDDLAALRAAVEKQAVVLADGTDADVIAFATDELQAAVQVFHVRGGRVRGQRGWIVEKGDDVDEAELAVQFCLQVYGGDFSDNTIPKQVLVPVLPDSDEVVALETLLTEQRGGGRVELRVPQRGDKRSLLETVRRNAEQALSQHKLKRATDLTARSAALSELQQVLNMGEAPLRIECYDISHGSGQDVVGSMVVFEDGVARKSQYRVFNVRGDAGNDDTAALKEVLRRRFQRYLDARATTGEIAEAYDEAVAVRPGIDPQTQKPRKFAYPPQLVVVDGGQPQVNAAAQTMAELGLANGDAEITLVGLAKRLEEVWLPHQPFPLILPRASEALYLLQRVRDEAHRFAILKHRAKRAKRVTGSVLETIPGLGQSRRNALIRHFGSVKNIRSASPDELTSVAGIGPTLAATIHAALTDQTGAAVPKSQAGRSE